MKFHNYLIEIKIKTPKQWVKEYMENMIDNGDIIRSADFNDNEYFYKTWKDFFKGAVNGAYDWSEVLWNAGQTFEEEKRIDRVRDGILKMKDSGFAQEKKIFKQRRKEGTPTDIRR